jgi:SM-20-related protein
MDALNLAAFGATPLNDDPFEYLIVPNFIRLEALGAINRDYPQIEEPGSFPLVDLEYGPAFSALMEALEGPQVQAAFEDKFRFSLKGRPKLITVRGRCAAHDGRIHTDGVSKIITALLYLNPRWEQAGGRLRLLRSAEDFEDVVVEVPPTEGTLVAFRRRDNSFHGHRPFRGPRRVIQLNWLTDQRAHRRGILRHRISAWAKRMGGVVRPHLYAPTEASHAPGSVAY